MLSAQVVIDHHYTNTDAQSLIGLPMGSHKTIVDKQGDLKWSQWSLKRKPLDTPIGFSSQTGRRTRHPGIRRPRSA